MRRVAVTLGLALALGACNHSDKRSIGHSFSAEGVAVNAPQGWHGRAMGLRVGHGVRPKAFVQVANFPLRRPPPKSMKPGQAVLTVAEDYGLVAQDASIASARSPLQRSEFLPASSPRVPAGQALAGRTFSIHGRNFRLAATFGARPGEATFSQVNEALASLSVKPVGPVSNTPIGTPAARLRACTGKRDLKVGGYALGVAGMSCEQARPLVRGFAPHPGETVQQLHGFTCYSHLIPRRTLRVVCIHDARVFRFDVS
jgi:hypothetical protein